jgi:hypothetical protein
LINIPILQTWLAKKNLFHYYKIFNAEQSLTADEFNLWKQM